METKYSICDKLVFLNTAEGRFEESTVKGIQIIPTGVSKDEAGEDRLDGSIVLYQMSEGLTLTENEVFRSAEEAKEYYLSLLDTLRVDRG